MWGTRIMLWTVAQFNKFTVVNFDIIPGWCSSLLMYKLNVQGWCKIHGSNRTENIPPFLKDSNDSSFKKNA